MREILFRGKSKKQNEWIEGYFIKQNDEFYILNNPEFILNNDSGTIGACIYSVFEASIGQYIWNEDKNGNKIFQGNYFSILDSSHYSFASDFLIEKNSIEGTLKALCRIGYPKYEYQFFRLEVLHSNFTWKPLDTWDHGEPDFRNIEVFNDDSIIIDNSGTWEKIGG